ncbi:MAG: SapC family protein [Limimaricola sp.]|uniref:SapC family protein n=1 Tax=Limimaricola sp. TaxID=2211665 RepID=UPI001DA77A6B|nr:SapC family protein [Limimaricola sp.]MBI1415965.1 SapC family protein [Limimaricola sp.]
MPNPLFYSSVVALNRDAHRRLKLTNRSARFGFASESHLVPAMVEEFTAAAPELPIAFLPGGPAPSPVFVAGLAPGQNLIVDAEGGWDAGYVPAYLRRYPFIIGETTGTDPVLCVDSTYDGLTEDEGDPLFDEEGAPTRVVQDAIELTGRFRDAATRTQGFCSRLNELGLLRSVTLDVKRPSGETTVVHGLMTVDEAALAELPEEDFLRLRKDGYLPAIYAHLLSLRTLDRLNDKLTARQQMAAE